MQQREFAKKASILALGLRILCALLCLGSLFVPFADGLKSVIASDSGPVVTNYGPAFAFLFGGKITAGHVSYTALGISSLGTTAFVLIAVAFVLLLIQLFLKKKNIARILVFCAAALALTSAIMALCLHESTATVLADSILGRHSDSVTATMIRNTTVEFGFWGISMFGFIAGALLLSSFVLDGTVDEIRMKFIG